MSSLPSSSAASSSEEGTRAARTVTKKDLIDRIAENSGLRRVDVKSVVQSFLDEVTSEVGAGNRLEFRDFGVFEVKERAARTAQNPKTLQRVEVPAKRTVKFKAGRLMKQALEAPAEPAQSAAEMTPEQISGRDAAAKIEIKTRSVASRPATSVV